jgi:alpha-1,6-mannosyltransferase
LTTPTDAVVKVDPRGAAVVEAHPIPRQISLNVAGATGFFGAICVLIGVAQSGSPFTSKLPNAWFFGLGNGASGAGHNSTFLGIALLYLGVILMIGSWFEVIRTLQRNPGTPVRAPLTIIGIWTVPILVMPPLFSRDVYSYAAQGEMVTRGINPYLHGPTALGPNPYLRLVDPIWRNARAPYGPAWERLAGAIVQLARHNVVATIVGFRLVALIGVGLIAWGVAAVARSVGRDPAAALALAVLNPLVLLVLLGGAHNDALMLGLLVAGCAAARRNHVLIALVLCALAAEVKIPALIGALFIGWWWSDGSAPWRHRTARAAGAFLMVAGLMGVIGLLSGLGWHWLDELTNPGTVVSWADPMTALGLALSHASGALGFGAHSTAFVQTVRAVGLAAAAVISIGLMARWKTRPIAALGWSLLAFVVLGPVVWPWYESWGFVFLAVIAEAWTLRLILALSAIACFADLPNVRYDQSADPALTAVGWLVLVGVAVAYGIRRLKPSITASHHVPLR